VRNDRERDREVGENKSKSHRSDCEEIRVSPSTRVVSIISFMKLGASVALSRFFLSSFLIPRPLVVLNECTLRKREYAFAFAARGEFI